MESEMEPAIALGDRGEQVIATTTDYIRLAEEARGIKAAIYEKQYGIAPPVGFVLS